MFKPLQAMLQNLLHHQYPLVNCFLHIETPRDEPPHIIPNPTKHQDPAVIPILLLGKTGANLDGQPALIEVAEEGVYVAE